MVKLAFWIRLVFLLENILLDSFFADYGILLEDFKTNRWFKYQIAANSRGLVCCLLISIRFESVVRSFNYFSYQPSAFFSVKEKGKPLFFSNDSNYLENLSCVRYTFDTWVEIHEALGGEKVKFIALSLFTCSSRFKG